MSKLVPVILSGGAGTRLWPLSRAMMPKQFHRLLSDKTLLQETLLRLQDMEHEAPFIVCNDDHRFIVAENLREISKSAGHIILEPEGRNTAPAIALAAHLALQEGEDPTLLVLPADHKIANEKAFINALQSAIGLAQNGELVTFGIKPDKPHTGYGYIACGKKYSDGVHHLSAFKEKPEAQTAQMFLDDGGYLWNSGMFVFKASAYLEALSKSEPDIIKYTQDAVQNARKDLDFTRIEESAFKSCKSISIDYAIMEHADNAVVVTLDAGWSDIGTWETLYESVEKDNDSNALLVEGKGEIEVMQSKGNYIFSEQKLVTVVGARNLMVVDTKDALLVTMRDNAYLVKDIVETLQNKERSEVAYHRTVYRPWGHYDLICAGEKDQVKRITVKPGAKLSLQKHEHRSEHWIVVKGIARVTKENDVFDVRENESVYLPCGIKHALENPHEEPLQIIEVQTGNYLGEDDIVRFEDLYGRK